MQGQPLYFPIDDRLAVYAGLELLATATLLMVAALGLTACGRKGPLDPPPTAGLTTPQSSTSRPSIGEESELADADKAGR